MKMKFLSTALVGILAASMLSIGASASDLDNLGGQLPSTAITQAAQPAQPATSDAGTSNATANAQAISNAYSDLAPTAEDINAAKEIVSPVVKYVNLGIGIVVALLGTFLLAVTALDLLYIVSPSFIRNIGGSAAPQQGGMGGMGGMGAPQPQQHIGGFAGLISDDCKAALAECGDGAAAAPMGGMGGMGGGFGGMGGGFGGMGGGFGGMGGMGAPAAAPKKKTVALCYLKKRAFSLVLIGICIVVLTCTVFLDVGTKLGMWIVQMISGAV